MPTKFTITDTVSTRAWGEVDKSRIWQILKQGLQEGAEGVTAAVREVYAVVKAPINKELTQADCWGPHHEIRDDGTIVLNPGGLVAAAAELAGARAEPNLTPQQKRQGARHLLKHYQEQEMEPPESLQEMAGEIFAVQATVCGEIKVEDIPLAPWANLEALKAGDLEPMEVVVEIPAGKSKRGWNYRPEALQAIVSEVMKQGLPGFLGHQKPEDVEYAFPQPVTHWVGALWKDGKAYFRGVVDKAASDLKRWIKANVIRTVSIFGVPKLQQVAGETQVVDFKPLSIDWTPLGRAGMPTAVVAIGEMDEIITGGGEKQMSWKELAAQLKQMLRNKDVTLKEIIGEMSISTQELAEEIGEIKEALKAKEILSKIREVFGVSGEIDIVKVAEDAKKVLTAKMQEEQEKLINEVLSEKVTGEIAQALVKKMLKVPAGNVTKEQIIGEIDKILEDETVKAIIGKFYTDKPLILSGSKDTATLRVKKQVI